MKKSKKMFTKSRHTRLLKASKEINLVSSLSLNQNHIAFNDTYRIIKDSDDIIKYSLYFYNNEVIASTNSYYDIIDVDEDTVIELEIKGSIEKYSLSTNKQILGKSLRLFSAITTTNGTTLPSNFKAELIIEGGKTKVVYPINNLIELTEIGQTIELDISIFFY